jgi:stage II sporulation protein D
MWLGQSALALLLIALVFSCSSLPTMKEERGGSFMKIPFVRVLLSEETANETAGANRSFAIECLKEKEQSLFYASKPVILKSSRSGISVQSSSGQTIASGLTEVNLIPRGNDNRLMFGDVRYRGILKFRIVGQNLRVINVVFMEDYLRGVVPPEIGPRKKAELEAVKAQAVAARTYAMAHLKQYGNKPYDMRNSIIDQVYNGADAENDLTNLAIDATAGQVLMYGEEFINAYYHSTCGGMTDDIQHVWDKPEQPYLKAVADSGACSWSKYYTWTETFTEQQLRSRVEQYLSSDRGRDLRIGRIIDVQIDERSPGGRVVKMIVRSELDYFRFFRDRIRWVVGRTSNPDLILPSDRFDLNVERNGKGEIERIVFTGRGYGHGVGMCQCGAIGLSRDDWTFDRILKHYYSGIEIRKLY